MLERKLRTLIVATFGVNLIFTRRNKTKHIGGISSRPKRKGKAAARLSPSIRLSPKLEGVVFYRLPLSAHVGTVLANDPGAVVANETGAALCD